jgi:hypothetical protein
MMKKEELKIDDPVVESVAMYFDDRATQSEIETTIGKFGIVLGILKLAPAPQDERNEGATLCYELAGFAGLRKVEFKIAPGYSEKFINRRFDKIMELAAGAKDEDYQ